jgi:hypothetical protein
MTPVPNRLGGDAEPLLSLRSFLDAVDGFGELRHARGAHWDLELGAVAAVADRGPLGARAGRAGRAGRRTRVVDATAPRTAVARYGRTPRTAVASPPRPNSGVWQGG